MKSNILSGLVGGIVVLAFAYVGIASGAAGDNFILGQVNNSGVTTELQGSPSGNLMVLDQNGGGVPLAIQGPGAQPPFSVTSSKKVVNLNADKVDGTEVASLMRRNTYDVVRTDADSDIDSVDGDVFCDQAFEACTVLVLCDSGDKVLGGDGYVINSPGSTLLGSDAIVQPNNQGWSAFWRNDGTVNDATAIAVCSDFPPAH
jgi:hypothetical protein